MANRILGPIKLFGVKTAVEVGNPPCDGSRREQSYENDMLTEW